MNQNLKKHIAVIPAVLSLVACLLPFFKVDVSVFGVSDSESMNIFDILGEEFNFFAFLLIVFPIAFIAVNYLVKADFKKFVLMGIPVLSIISAIIFAISYSSSEDFEGFASAGSKPAIGFFFALLTYIGSVVCSFIATGGDVSTISETFSKEQISEQFEELKKQAKNVAEKSAEKIGSISEANSSKNTTSSKEKRNVDPRVAEINKEIADIDEKLQQIYAKIGSKISSGKTDTSEEMNVAEELKSKRETLEKQRLDIEKSILNEKNLNEKLELEKKFNADKESLDKALALEVITKDEYDIKLNALKKRIDNFDEIKRIETQFELGIISEEEKTAKTAELLR